MTEDTLFLESVLKSVPIHCINIGDAIEGTVRQEYVNTQHVPLEIVYTYPTPACAVITGLNISVGDREIKTQIMEKELAYKEYARAIVDGNSAFLLESERLNVNRITLGRVEPGERIVAETKFCMNRTMIGNGVRIAIPTAIAPRYIPCRRLVSGENDVKSISPPIGETGYMVEFSMDIEPLGNIKVEESPSHDIIADKGVDGRWHVSLKNGCCEADRDIVVLYHYTDDESKTCGIIGKDRNESILMARFVPEIQEEENTGARAYSIILDCSGSMSSYFDRAKTAVEETFGYMKEGDEFQVICFNDSLYDVSCMQMQPYNSCTIESAINCLSNIHADGGTEMIAPLHMTLGQAQNYSSYNIILITDGLVENDREIILMVKERLGRNTRCFTVGIGNAANSYLINELAAEGNGFAEHVFPGEDMYGKIERQMMRCACSRVTDVKLTWADGKTCTDVEPPKPLELFDGDAAQLLLRLDGTERWPLTLSGNLSENEWEQRLSREALVQGSYDFLGRIYARERITRLERDCDLCENDNVKKELKKRVLKLSLKYGVLSRWTTFFSKMLRDSANLEIPRTHHVPVAYACEIRQPLSNVWQDVLEDEFYEPQCMFADKSNVSDSYDVMPEVRKRVRQYEQLQKQSQLNIVWGDLLKKGGYKRYKLKTDRCLSIIQTLWSKMVDINDKAKNCKDIKGVLKRLINDEQLSGCFNVNYYNAMLLIIDEYLGIYAFDDVDRYIEQILKMLREAEHKQVPSWLENRIMNFLRILVPYSGRPKHFSGLMRQASEALRYSLSKTNMKEAVQTAFLLAVYHRRYNNIEEE